MIIDCHGHFTTVPQSVRDWRARQLRTANDPSEAPGLDEAYPSDDAIRQAIVGGQLKLQDERGSDLTLFSPIAGLMGHPSDTAQTSANWARVSNDNVLRVSEMFPDRFAPVCQLPQAVGVPPAEAVPELRRCVEQLGFVGCNINPDPSGGYWTGKPFTDREWYPLFEAMCDLDVPGMVHVAGSCNPNFQSTGAHYLNADTSVFMQLLQSDLFRDFPTLRLVIPHGGGAVPYHWGRYRGMSLEMMQRPLEGLLDNVFFDSCVYHKPGIALLAEVVPVANVLFGSEMIGAVRGKDPATGYYFDDTRRYFDALGLAPGDLEMIYEHNVRRVYPRLDARLKEQGR